MTELYDNRACGPESDSAARPKYGVPGTETGAQEIKEKKSPPPAPKNQPALLKDASPVFDPSAPAAPPEEIRKPEPQQQKPVQNDPAGKPDPLHRNAFTRPRRPVVNPQAAQNLYRQEQHTQSQPQQPVYQPSAYQQPVYYQPAQQTPPLQQTQQRYAQPPVQQQAYYQPAQQTPPPQQRYAQPPVRPQTVYQQREMPETVSEPPETVITPETEQTISPESPKSGPAAKDRPAETHPASGSTVKKKKKKKKKTALPEERKPEIPVVPAEPEKPEEEAAPEPDIIAGITEISESVEPEETASGSEAVPAVQEAAEEITEEPQAPVEETVPEEVPEEDPAETEKKAEAAPEEQPADEAPTDSDAGNEEDEYFSFSAGSSEPEAAEKEIEDKPDEKPEDTTKTEDDVQPEAAEGSGKTGFGGDVRRAGDLIAALTGGSLAEAAGLMLNEGGSYGLSLLIPSHLAAIVMAGLCGWRSGAETGVFSDIGSSIGAAAIAWLEQLVILSVLTAMAFISVKNPKKTSRVVTMAMTVLLPLCFSTAPALAAAFLLPALTVPFLAFGAGWSLILLYSVLDKGGLAGSKLGTLRTAVFMLVYILAAGFLAGQFI